MNALAAKALFDASVAQLESRVIAARGWVIHCETFPSLDVSFRDPARQEIRVRLDCEDWNDSPPSVSLLDADGNFLVGLPQQRPGSTIFNAGPHDRTKRPFVCMVGIREYHEHSGHRTDLWTNYKNHGNYTLGNILEQLWNGWWRFWP